MITIVCGKPGAGKTSLLAFLKIRTMTVDRVSLLKRSIGLILPLNAAGYHFTLPTEHVTYSNFWTVSKGKFIQVFTDYSLDGFEFGLPDPEHPTKLIPPGSQLFLMESQSFLNSRVSMSFRDSVSRAYENHRHWHLDIFLDAQRATLIDLNVRELAGELIEVEKLTLDYDKFGAISACKWQCKVFTDASAFEAYLSTGKAEGEFEKREYVFQGNIFECYDSHQNFALWLEGAENKDFSYMHNEKPMPDKEYIERYIEAHSLNNMSRLNYYKNSKGAKDVSKKKAREGEENPEAIEILLT